MAAGGISWIPPRVANAFRCKESFRVVGEGIDKFGKGLQRLHLLGACGCAQIAGVAQSIAGDPPQISGCVPVCLTARPTPVTVGCTAYAGVADEKEKE